MEDVHEKDIQDLLNEINAHPEVSLLEKIVSYCEETGFEPQDVGDALSECEQFKRMLWINAVDNNQVHDIKLKEMLNSTEDLDDW